MSVNSPHNKKMIRLLAVNTLKANRLRFIVSGIAIALTALLLTGVFTMGLSLYETDKLQALYRNGGRFHGVIQNIGASDMEKLIYSNEFTEYGYFSALSRYPAVLPDGSRLPLEIAYGSENLPDITLTRITGRMPEQKNEAAMSTAALDRFGVPHKIGEKFTMTYTVDGTDKTTEFTVCGFWRENPDGAVMKSRVFVSKEFAEAEAFDDDIFLFVNLDKPEQVYNRLTALTEKLRIEAHCAANPVYDEYESGYTSNSNIIANTLAPFAVLLLLIMVSAYLLIYNIFYISVTRDIKFYGLLRAIGATKKQIRRIIRLQALFLSIVGIPVGLILGYVVSLIIVPSLLNLGSYGVYSISSNPLIFAFAAVFALITVLISASRPGAFAGRVSPMAAVRHVEGASKIRRRERKTSHGAKPFVMAARNIFRGKKKLILSIISLSTGIGLFCVSISFMSSFSLEMYLKVRMYGDLRVSNPLLNDAFENTRDTVTPDFVDKVLLIDSVKSAEELYYLDAEDAELKSDETGYTMVDGQVKEVYNVRAEVFGLTGGWIDSLSEFIAEGEFDAVKFRSGDYCIISKTTKTAYDNGAYLGAETIYYYKLGDKIKIKGMDKEFIVMALINDTSLRITGEERTFTNRYELYLPADTVAEIDGAKIMSLAIFADKLELPAVESAVRTLLSDKEGLELASAETYKKEFNNQTGALTTIALGLSILLCMIGMTNFINTFATTVIARQYEFSVLEGIGMTKFQLKSMLTLECLYTGGMSLIISFALSYPLSSRIVGNMVRENGFMEFRYSWASILIWLVFIGLSSVITSLASYRNISRESLSSRLISN